MENLQTFGLSVAVCQQRWPHYDFGSLDALTPARLEGMWRRAAARVCAALLRQKPTLDLTTLTEVATPVTWEACQHAVLDQLAPELEQAVNPSLTVDRARLLMDQAKHSLQQLLTLPDLAGPALSGAAPNAVGSYTQEAVPPDRGSLKVNGRWGGKLRW